MISETSAAAFCQNLGEMLNRVHRRQGIAGLERRYPIRTTAEFWAVPGDA